jgi:PAS domain-containing protein
MVWAREGVRMEKARGKHIALILARELAANVATPMLIVDPENVLVYFNEPAEALLGETFASTGEMPVSKWGVRYAPEHMDGTAYDLARFPLATALVDRRPAHDTFRFTGADGTRRTVTAAAYPLLVSENQFAGAVAIFWQRSEHD